ncbi:MAG TPA: hypothetical protein VGX25_30535 [Actinophytocola sp.]|uniref:hypothetical protein n=1 Tax=Actinophytocola sp. TaxID=1872138 RepID=UPI002DDD255A|nr:hypothetical protein [Actinophytocola sp.]HEV2783746.1 hypothetical protein [Actinophytocola sp.]
MPRARILVMLVAAVGLAVFGVSRFLAALDTPPAAGEVASVDGLTAAVTTASWTKMDHDMSSNAAPGFQMPPAMMPNMPQGDDQRLALSVTVTNTSGDTRPIRATEEFTLRAGKDGRQWTPTADTFGDLPRLAPRNAVTGVLFFDLPPAELAAGPAWVEWSHGDATTRLTIPLDGVNAGPGHSHTP